jgi:hypothetical protein
LFRIYAACNELWILTHDFLQNGFAILINERHVVQVNDALARITLVACISPGQPELSRPRPDQATLEKPSLLVGQIGDSDPQHVDWPGDSLFTQGRPSQHANTSSIARVNPQKSPAVAGCPKYDGAGRM